jgi:hypothetical protein
MPNALATTADSSVVPFDPTQRQDKPKAYMEPGPDNRIRISKENLSRLSETMPGYDVDTIEYRVQILYDLIPALSDPEAQLNAILDDIDSIRPTDAMEWSLVETMLLAREHKRLALKRHIQPENWSDCISQDQMTAISTEAGKVAIKFAQLEIQAAESLTKMRRKGRQTMVVQHVQVNDGGQAVVGHHVQGGK